MPLFRRRRTVLGRPTAATDFWSWWAGAAPGIADALDHARATAAGGDPGSAPGVAPAVDAAVAAHVTAVHPQLRHAFVQGRRSRHGLAVSGRGRPELRALTERWRLAGPGDDDTWEFHAALPAAPERFDGVTEIAGRRVELGATLVEARADDQRCRLDVAVHHPAFAGLREDDRQDLSLLVLQWALGEDDVERWIGEVVAVDHRPLDAVPARVLGAVAGQLAQRWAGDRWALLEGVHGNRRLVATVRHPLHRVDHPRYDEHVTVRLPYDDRTLDGLPGVTASGDLEAFEQALVARVGADAVLVAHETSSGERVLHLYDDVTASVVPAIEAMLGGYLGRGATVEAEHDPAWRSVEHLRL